MRIIDLSERDTSLLTEIADLLVAGFAEHWPSAWPDRAAGLEEVRESLQEGRISKVAVGEDGHARGWIGGISEYDGHTWELHPLVVHPDHRRQGIGRALVVALEEEVRRRGATTIMLGTDDEDGSTTLSGVDLYPDVFAHIAAVRNLKGHPYEFYQRLGYVIVGVVPDANGRGKPDILMAKRVESTASGEENSLGGENEPAET